MSELKWKSDTTLGKKLILVAKRSACSKKDKNGGRESNAVSSPTRLAEVIATKNNVFRDKRRSSQVAAGSKGFRVRHLRTRGRFHNIQGGLPGGCASNSPRRKCFANGWEKMENPST